MGKEILVLKDTVVIFTTILNEEYICISPRSINPGVIEWSANTVVGKLQYDTKYRLSFPLSEHIDSNGNSYQKVEPGPYIVIDTQLLGVRPPILRYP